MQGPVTKYAPTREPADDPYTTSTASSKPRYFTAWIRKESLNNKSRIK